MSLKVEKGPFHKPGYTWCQYCELYVVNNAPSVRDHEKSIRHIVNVQKYEQRMKKQANDSTEKERKINEDLLTIKAKAEVTYMNIDVLKKNDRTLLEESERYQNEIEKAKKLYGDQFCEEKIINQKKKLDPVEIYNSFMKSLPTKIQKKYRNTISEFK